MSRAADRTAMAEGQVSQEEVEARSKIGRRIAYWALGAVTLLGAVAVVVGKDKERATQEKARA